MEDFFSYDEDQEVEAVNRKQLTLFKGQQQQQQLIIVSALEAPARPGFVVGSLEELLFVLKLPLSLLDCGKQNMNENKFVVFQ